MYRLKLELQVSELCINFMAIMPSQISFQSNTGYQVAEVPEIPEFDFYLKEIEHQNGLGAGGQFAAEFHHSTVKQEQQLQHQQHIGGAAIPKIEPVLPPEYDYPYQDTPWPHNWHSSNGHHHPAHLQHPHPHHPHQYHTGNLPMAAYPPNGSPNSQPLQVSDPPTPAAECQVTSTNLSPIPHSPYSPNSDGSVYEGMDGLSAEGLGLDAGIIPFETEFSDVNIKGLTEEQLVSLTARDLNRICREMPEDVVKQLKKRRRTLKNRGYAYNSRVRRVTQKTALETERDDLRIQIQQLNDRCKQLEKEADQWKRKAQTLERGQI